MTRLNSVEYSIQWVWNVHMGLEWWTWVYKDEESIGNYYIKQCEKVSRKPCFKRESKIMCSKFTYIVIVVTLAWIYEQL